LKYKKSVVRELLYAYDCIKDIKKISNRLPMLIEKIAHDYKAAINKENISYRLSKYMHYSPPVGEIEGLGFLETLSELEKIDLIKTDMSNSIDNILEKEGIWKFPSSILNSKIRITEKWDIYQKNI
jgi:hypothetical protein